jgi:D-threo-aldose 1-dehydrogenase
MAAAALQFIIAHPVVVSVIPGGQNVKETRQNAEMLDVSIPAMFWQDVRAAGLIHPSAPTPQ